MKLSKRAQAEGVLFIVAPKDFNETEYIEPKQVLEQAGMGVMTTSTSSPAIGSEGMQVAISKLVGDITADDFQAIVIIGGKGAISLSNNKDVQRLIRQAAEDNRVVAAICHGPLVLAKAGVVNGYEVTSYTDKDTISVLKNSGGKYVDFPVVVSQYAGKPTIVTAQNPDSAYAFGRAIVDVLTEGIITTASFIKRATVYATGWGDSLGYVECPQCENTNLSFRKYKKYNFRCPKCKAEFSTSLNEMNIQNIKIKEDTIVKKSYLTSPSNINTFFPTAKNDIASLHTKLGYSSENEPHLVFSFGSADGGGYYCEVWNTGMDWESVYYLAETFEYGIEGTKYYLLARKEGPIEDIHELFNSVATKRQYVYWKTDGEFKDDSKPLSVGSSINDDDKFLTYCKIKNVTEDAVYIDGEDVINLPIYEVEYNASADPHKLMISQIATVNNKPSKRLSRHQASYPRKRM